ncbi:hypothetical protein A4X09_0g6350 [Tilletia walkeri]|uniref:Zn(2)-C6 fungal-type domain-containing protein n=1 Tax=Tilletia walkeri TaxID=117179 RepID=A0A8X7N5E5_9BASI|nr:hypothetical protein A4X09_0g6350 [Tilletia walkeri]
MSSADDNSDWQTAAVVAAAAAAEAAAHHNRSTNGPSPPPAFSSGTGLESTLAEAQNASFDLLSRTSMPAPAPTPTVPDSTGDLAIAHAGSSTSTPAPAPTRKGRASTASAKGKGKQKESSAADSNGKSTADDQHVKKRRRVVVACDTCRRKKIRCQGLPNDNHTCDNCGTYGYKCTFTFSNTSAENGESSGAASGAGGKGRMRGRYEILEAKVDSLLSILREVNPEMASQWESGELGAGAGALTGVKRYGSAKVDPEPSLNQNDAGRSSIPGPSPDAYNEADRDAASNANVSAQYNAYLNENVFAPSTSQSELLLDPALAAAQLAQAAQASSQSQASTSAAGQAQHRDRRRGRGGPGGDAHDSAGLLLHLSQAAVHIQERDQRAKDGHADDRESEEVRKRSGSNQIRIPSHLLPDIEEGRPRFYGKSSTLHFFNALDSRPSSPSLGRSSLGNQGEKRSASLGASGHDRGIRSRKAPGRSYPLNSKQWVRLLRQKNLVAVGRDDDIQDSTWFHRYQLPEPQTVASLLATYFSTFHPLLPIVHRLSLERDLAFGRAEHDTAFRGLVFTLLAIASRLGMSESENQRLDGLNEDERKKEMEEMATQSDYYAAGSRLYHQVYAASLINVQVLLLTAAFMHGSIGAGTAWTVLGVGIRVLLDIGLHSERAYAGFSPFEQELRRHVFWGAYILDCIFAVNMGRPPALRLDECSVRLPLDVSEDALLAAETGGPIDVTLPKGDQGHDANITSGFLHLVRLNILVGDVVQTLYVSKFDLSKFEPPHVRKDEARQLLAQQPPAERDMDRLLKALDEWVTTTPAHLQWPDVEPIFKMQAGLIKCGTHDIRLYILKPFLRQPSLKSKLFSQCMEHARELLDCVLKLFEDEKLSGIVFVFQQAFWSAATFMITVWHHYKNSSALAADQHLIEGTLRILFSSDPQFFSNIMHRALRLLQRIAKRAMSEMEPARRERVSAYVEADDLSSLTEIAPELARPAYNIQPLPPQFGTGVGAAMHRVGSGSGGGGGGTSTQGLLPWWQDAGRLGHLAQMGEPSQTQPQPPSSSQPQPPSSSTAVDGTSSANLWFTTEHETTRNELPIPSQLPSSSAPWSAGNDAMHNYTHAHLENGSDQTGVQANNMPTHYASADAMSGLTYYNTQLGTINSNNATAQTVYSTSGHGEQQQQLPQQQQHQQHQQQQLDMAHAQLQAAQSQIGFENSFGDAHGIAGVAGPNPSLDDLAWTDYFASFLASLSEQPGSNANHQHAGS